MLIFFLVSYNSIFFRSSYKLISERPNNGLGLKVGLSFINLVEEYSRIVSKANNAMREN
jgi:hypothetical protein